MFVPDFYVKKIETEAKVKDVRDRNFIAFDVNYLLSLFKSLNQKQYLLLLRQSFVERQKRLYTSQRRVPMMIQSCVIDKLREIF